MTAMTVPLFSPLAQNESLAAELQEKFEQVLASGYFILGPEVEAFESECAAYLGASHAIGVSSGTDALLIALMALDIGPGDEVIVPSFTFFATAGVVTRLGATPVFADVCPACYQIQPQEVSRLLSAKTRAVIPVHLFGHAADVVGIQQVVSGKDIAVVEDVAQSMGAQAGGRMAGTIGDVGCFSFFPTKNLGGFGDGGLVTTEDAALAEKVRRLRNHGMHPKYYHAEVGGNFRLDALQAALLRIKLPHLDGYLQRRQRNAEYYLSGLSALEGVAVNSTAACGPDCTCPREAGADALIGLPMTRQGQQPAWNQFTIRVKNGKRDELREFLMEAGIGAEVYYPVPLHEQQCFATDRPEGELVNTKVLSEEVLSLPVYPELELSQIDEVIRKISDWLS
jgi:dTDP-4-amino-4,6-dideoxygalactose transaminase